MPAATSVSGRYYDGRSSAATVVALSVDADGLLHLDPPLRAATPLRDLKAAARVAGVPLTLRYADDALLELPHTAAHAAWLEHHYPGTGRIARFEGSGRAIAAAVAVLVALFAAVAVWGVPLASRHVAERLPRDLIAPLAVETLDQLDRLLFEPSTLDAARRAAVNARFATLVPVSTDLVYRLEFRHGGPLGPNAIALPDATIVVTDELVDIADNDDEIAAVLLHEIGHVEQRHSLRQLISHAGLATLAGLVFGDISGIGGVLLAMPGMLMEQSYSRELEWEADTYALARLEQVGLDGRDFTTILDRLARCAEVRPTPKQSFAEACRAALKKSAATPPAADATAEGWRPYLSTHPSTEARLARFEQASRRPRD